MVSVTINGDEFEIHLPFFDCPWVRQKTFGVLQCRGTGLHLALAASVRYLMPPGGEVPPVINLPKLSKKVIYLDQHAISGMAKALRPKLPAKEDGTARPRGMGEALPQSWIGCAACSSLSARSPCTTAGNPSWMTVSIGTPKSALYRLANGVGVLRAV